MVMIPLPNPAIVQLESHLARLFGGFATRGGKFNGMGVQILDEFAAGRAANFKKNRETVGTVVVTAFPSVVAQEAAPTQRILLIRELTRKYRCFGLGLV
jgi:hypothetical protein